MLIAALGLAPATKRALRAVGIKNVDQLQQPANDLLATEAITGAMLYDVACRLHARDLGLRGNANSRPSEGDLEMLRLRVVEGFALRDIASIFDISVERVRQRLKARFGLSGDPPAVLERRRLRLAGRPEWERIIALRLCRAEDGLPLAVLLRGFADGPLGSEARDVVTQMKDKGLVTIHARRVWATEALCRMVTKRDTQGHKSRWARPVASRPL